MTELPAMFPLKHGAHTFKRGYKKDMAIFQHFFILLNDNQIPDNDNDDDDNEFFSFLCSSLQSFFQNVVVFNNIDQTPVSHNLFEKLCQSSCQS